MVILLYTIFYSWVFLLGICIGSFLNVVIYRLPNGEDIVFGRSHCMACGQTLRARDLIPVLSYCLLRGKCRNCGSRISPRYALVELLTGVVFVLTVWRFGITPLAAVACALAAVLIAISFIDGDTMTIPDPLVITALVLVVPFLFTQGDVSLLSRALGFFIISVPMLLMALAIGGAFGGGDIKLIAVLGLILGAAHTVLAAFLAIVLGGVYAIYLIASKKSQKGAQMPFGPCLCAGGYLSLLFGTPIITWYLSLL